ncbi:LysR family transcriptional regulator [Alkaliphilus hydrothermalis]|uniref:DNA-binding transcriptional LysR family regulator n=1 Tax=Alkaliphilus hydrothermalis TaxID=1482730 RepID=A0ABS2NST3_9FIRM|nr:LysR family transcriptional regulator [Alkaliphilus hydrothermalis]MBM7616008.1 DNA-binding transcriptional LysR family regulator [Alkaliphilus hydrothermalis]
MDVNLELYKIFYYVAKNLSFTKAAEELFVTQSSVSQSMAQLEKKLDIVLFHRTNRRVSLTHEGEMLFSHVSQAINIIKSGERILENTKVLEYGELKLGASDTICKYFLLPYFSQFHRIYPKIRINITNQPSIRTIESVRKGELDFGIINLPYDSVPNDLNVEVLSNFTEVLITNRCFFKGTEGITSIQQLMDYPLITLTKETSTRRYLDSYFQKHQLTLEPEFELESIDLIMELVQIGLGIGFVIDAAVAALKNEDVSIINLKEPLPTRSIAFISNKKLPLSIPAQEFLELLSTNKAD